MLPADQGLGAGKARRIGLDVIFRLVKDLELALVGRAVQVVEQSLVQKLFHPHIVVVKHQRVLKVAPDPVAGSPGMVKHHQRLHAFLPGLDPHAQADTDLSCQAVDPVLKAVQQGPVVRLLHTVNGKAVRFKTACDPLGSGKESVDFLSDDLKHPVAEAPSVQSVDGVKLLNVDDNGIHMQFRMILKNALRVFHKEVPGIEHAELVMLGRRDELPSLAQFDDSAHTGQNHFLLVKGLGNKVRCAHLQRLQFGGSFRRQDDNRNLPKQFIVAHGLQHFKPVQDRHHQVKQYNGQPFPLLPHDFQRFFSVLSVEKLIIILQNRAQHIPVDLLIVNDQNQLWPLNLF